MQELTAEGKHVMRVTGKRDENGNPLGMFAEGELLWHSNESGTLTFTPGVALLGAENMIGSSTGFITTPDYYENVSNSFRSELDEMFMDHDFFADRLSTGLHPAQSRMMKKNFAPEPSVLPLVIQSPGGIKGLHYSPHTVGKVHGMSLEESDKFLQWLGTELFKEPHVYDHWYQDNGDLLIFDNSITLHRRLGDVATRLLLRSASSYNKILDHIYQPYFHKDYAQRYKDRIEDMYATLGLGVPKPFV
jgi:alpha-ketoglutarate-dependent taurine dioxygenase